MDLGSFLLGLLVGAANALVWVWYAHGGGDYATWLGVHVSGYTLAGVVWWFASKYQITQWAMKCPQCERGGLRSKVYSRGGTMTLMYYPSFYDEDGNYHVHDSNHRDARYTCSNGHKWWVELPPLSCPTCGDAWWKGEGND